MKKTYLLLATTFALVACDNNNDSPSTISEVTRVSATIGYNNLSRASGNTWTPNDEIGITTNVGSARPQMNIRYRTDGSSTFTGNQLYYYTGMVLNAYYPFTGTEGTLPGNAGVITVNTRIGNQSQSTQPKIDFLWDTQTGLTGANPSVNFNFAHKMSKITFVFKQTSQTKVTDIEGYDVIGLRHEGTFNTNTGVCSAKSDAAKEEIPVRITKGSMQNGDETAPLIFFPQTVAADQVQLRLHLNEIEGNTNPDYVQKYTCTLKFDGNELKAGYHYKFSVNIAKAGIVTGTMSIEEWTPAEPKDETATIDGTPFKNKND